VNILVNDIPTYYRDEGQGKVLLMLHGWGSDLTTFNNLTTWAMSSYRVVRLDLPGFGITPLNDQSGWSAEDYAKFVQEFLEKLEINEVELLLGHSMGGRIAIQAVAGGYIKTRKLALLASHGIVENSLRNGFWAAVAKTGKLATLVLPEFWRQGLRRRLYSRLGVSDYVSADKAQKETFKKLISEDLRTTAKKIKIPTLLIYGSEDLETPARYGESFERSIATSRLWVIRGADHFVHISAFTKVTARLKEFLSS